MGVHSVRPRESLRFGNISFAKRTEWTTSCKFTANPTYDEPMSDTLSRRTAILLFAVVVFSWGVTWPVTKAIVAQVPPLWASTIRSGIAGEARFRCKPRRSG